MNGELDLPDIILVDENDQTVGTGHKMEVHQKGLLHRCFSIFILNSKNELLIQQRALTKYHSPGLWANTCCSHPRPDEEVSEAAHRRLQEELGFDCDLQEIFTFIYKAPFDNGLTEHEFDHVFLGHYNGEIAVNPEEVNAYQWIDLAQLEKDMQLHPEKYAAWLKICFEKFFAYNKNSSIH